MEPATYDPGRMMFCISRYGKARVGMVQVETTRLARVLTPPVMVRHVTLNGKTLEYALTQKRR